MTRTPSLPRCLVSLVALRRYIAMSGYELISKELGLENTDYLCVYSALRQGLYPEHHIRRLARMLDPKVHARVNVGNHRDQEDLPDERDWVAWTRANGA